MRQTRINYNLILDNIELHYIDTDAFISNGNTKDILKNLKLWKTYLISVI